MNHVPETVLQESLALLERGESIDTILTHFAEMADELRPFLETASQVASFAPQPSLAAKKRSQKQFLAHAESLKVTPLRPSRGYRLRQFLLPIASLALVLLLFATAAASVSASAIPGDALYPVKRLVETARLNLTSDPEAAVALIEQYREERVREVQALLRTNRTADVMFDGLVENIEESHWTVASIKTGVTESTVISGTPQLDELARVNGRTENGRLFAASIEMLTGSPNAPEANPTPALASTETPTETTTATVTVAATEISPSATPTASSTTNTPIPTATTNPSTTSSATPTKAATAAPPATATAPPSPTPTNDDNGNDNDDNGNDNEGNDNDDNGNDNDDDDDDNHNGGNDNDDNGNDNDDNDNDGNDNDDNENDNDDNDNDNDDDDD